MRHQTPDAVTVHPPESYFYRIAVASQTVSDSVCTATVDIAARGCPARQWYLSAVRCDAANVFTIQGQGDVGGELPGNAGDFRIDVQDSFTIRYTKDTDVSATDVFLILSRRPGC